MLGSTYTVDGKTDGRKTGRLYRTLLEQVRQKWKLKTRSLSNTSSQNIYIEDIYFFEVNTKYISSNVSKISVISQVHSTR